MEDERITYIYVLFDPREPEVIRYVGKTIDLKIRITHHKRAAKLNRHYYVYHWINKIRAEGVDFAYRVVEECLEDWVQREQYWIKYYRESGHPLTNITDGGEGICGIQHSEETKKKMSDASLGVPKSAEHRLRMRETRLGVPRNNRIGSSGYKYVVKAKNKFRAAIWTKRGLHYSEVVSSIEEAAAYVEEFLNSEEYRELQA